MNHLEPFEPRRLFFVGGLDPTYGGGDGIVDVAINSRGWSPADTDVAVDAGGRVLIAGVYGGKKNQFSVARLTANGAADATFGDGGFATAKLPLDRGGDVQISVDARGRTLVMIGTSRGATVTRLTASGALDPKFGKAGTATVPIVSSVADLTTDAGGNVLIVGTSKGKTGGRATIVRLSYRGRLDAAFGRGGAYKAPVPQAGDVGFRPASPPDPEDGFNEVRIKGDGTGSALHVLNDGRIVGVEIVSVRSELFQDDIGPRDFTTAEGVAAFRLAADGTLDPTYGSGGRVFRTGVNDSQGDDVHAVTFEAFAPDGGVVLKNVLIAYDSRRSEPERYFTDWTALDAKGKAFRGDAAPDLPNGNYNENDGDDYVLEDGYERSRVSVFAVQPDGRWLSGRRRVSPGLVRESMSVPPVAVIEANFQPGSTGNDPILAGDRAFSFFYDGSTIGVEAIKL